MRIPLKLIYNQFSVRWTYAASKGFAFFIRKSLFKLIVFLLQILAYPVAICAYIYGIKFYQIKADRIGHLVLEADCVLKDEYLGHIPNPEKAFFLIPESKCANPHFLTYIRSRKPVISSPVSVFLAALINPFGLLEYNTKKYCRLYNAPQDAYRVYRDWGDREAVFKLTPEDEAWAKEQFRQLNIDPDKFFVCFNVREAGFTPYDDDAQNFRNANPANIIPALEEIVRQGGQAIFMGSPHNTSLPPIAGVIDYAHSSFKSDRLDIILAAKCLFFLGNTSGISFVSTVFGIPCALANMVPISSLGYAANDISIPKQYLDQENGQICSLREITSRFDQEFRFSSDFEENGITLIENTPDQIHMLVCEMFDRLNGEFSLHSQDAELRQIIRSHLTEKHYAFSSLSNHSVYFAMKYKSCFF